MSTNLYVQFCLCDDERENKKTLVANAIIERKRSKEKQLEQDVGCNNKVAGYKAKRMQMH